MKRRIPQIVCQQVAPVDRMKYVFDNGIVVTIGDGWWDWYQPPRADYQFGGLMVQDGTVVDFDGCYDLPDEVKLALEASGYGLDID